eukprot:1150903-Pelagomonas_calceolata.AAC.2
MNYDNDTLLDELLEHVCLDADREAVSYLQNRPCSFSKLTSCPAKQSKAELICTHAHTHRGAQGLPPFTFDGNECKTPKPEAPERKQACHDGPVPHPEMKRLRWSRNATFHVQQMCQAKRIFHCEACVRYQAVDCAYVRYQVVDQDWTFFSWDHKIQRVPARTHAHTHTHTHAHAHPVLVLLTKPKLPGWLRIEPHIKPHKESKHSKVSEELCVVWNNWEGPSLAPAGSCLDHSQPQLNEQYLLLLIIYLHIMCLHNSFTYTADHDHPQLNWQYLMLTTAQLTVPHVDLSLISSTSC